MGALCLLLSATMAVDYGWEPAPDGSLTYLIQVEPELLSELQRPGFAIESAIPEDLRGVRRFRVYVGTGEVPRIGSPHAAVQAQWSQYVEPAAATGAGSDYLNRNVPLHDPYGVANDYVPPPFQTPEWRNDAVTKEAALTWSEISRQYMSPGAAGASAPPLTLPPGFSDQATQLPANAWDQANTAVRNATGFDANQALPTTRDRIREEWNSGLAKGEEALKDGFRNGEAALNQFGDKLANDTKNTINAWTGADVTRSPAAAAAPVSPIGTNGAGFAAAPPLSNPATSPLSNPAAASRAGQLGGGLAAPPLGAAGGAGFSGGPALTAPAASRSSLDDPRPASPLNGGQFGGLGGPAGGNSLDAGPSPAIGGGIRGGSSFDAPPLAGGSLGGGAPAIGGGSLDGGLGSTGSLGGGGFGGGAGVGGSLDGPAIPDFNGGSFGGGSLGGGLNGGGSLAGSGSSFDAGGGLNGGGSLGGGLAGGSLDRPATLPGEQPFGVPAIGGARPSDDSNPFGVPIVSRTEVSPDRLTLPYSAIPLRPGSPSDILDGPPAFETDRGPLEATPVAGWNWDSSFDEDGRPWGPLFATAVVLFLSIGLNCYLFWISRGLYQRYKDLLFGRRGAAATAG